MKAPDSKKPTSGAVGFKTTGALASTAKEQTICEVYMTNFNVLATPAQPIFEQSGGDGPQATFAAEQPDHGRFVREFGRNFSSWHMNRRHIAVRGSEFLFGLAEMFGCSKKIARIECMNGDDVSTIDLFGRIPSDALQALGLRRACWKEPGSRIYWRQGSNVETAPMYPLSGLGQLADLLAEAGEVRQ